ncbi:hypothetical protein [Pseudomonas fluorescens]|uniref:EAL domain-containing protein n=1 Tax=Pseudomonas fluorescens TaxID=294 RepID=A0A5E7SFT5_PSEFL|nr:hypothetical protein [Pseudomonas fluorescens]VVP84855.1 hypothetical protein PS941_01099 [Pseudomonas fluorescens]
MQVVTHEKDWSQCLSGQAGPDLIVCDSLPAQGGIRCLRRLCEHFGFLSVIECQALDVSIRWGLAHFWALAGKYFVGSYGEIVASQIDELLRKTFTVKRTVKRHSHGGLPRAASTAINGAKMELDIDLALALEQIVVFYQPQVCLRTRSIIGVEVLARWTSAKGPTGAAVLP